MCVIVITVCPEVSSQIVCSCAQVHKDEDDLGRGNETDSLTTGHAGPRWGCCIIMETSYSNETMTTAEPGAESSPSTLSLYSI